MKIGIATARIEGIAERPSFSSNHGNFVWSLYFSKGSSFEFQTNITTNVGDTKEASEKCWTQLKSSFESIGIKDGDKVSVLFWANGTVKAIGLIGHDCWIDVENFFLKKSFFELNLNIRSLKVF